MSAVERFGAGSAVLTKSRDSLTVTEKAIEVMRMANRVDATLEQIEARLLPPQPQVPGPANPVPDPDHIIFVLEATEARLQSVCNRLDNLLQRV